MSAFFFHLWACMPNANTWLKCYEMARTMHHQTLAPSYKRSSVETEAFLLYLVYADKNTVSFQPLSR